MRTLFFCGALASGEYLASFAPDWAGAWPFFAGCALLVSLFGYGLAARGWWVAAVFLLGAALFLAAEESEAERFRERPWMRGRVMRRTGGESRAELVAEEVRRDLSQRVALGLEREKDCAGLSRAILLGERRRLPVRIKRLFVESGTMHVFAISGLHVMAIANVLKTLLAVVFVPRRLSDLLALPLLWGYVMLIGAPPSAVRAATMATFSGIAPLFWRESNGLRSWALTFALIHVLQPQLIVHVGNALSFAVMLAVVVVGEVCRDRTRTYRALVTTLAAWAVGVPISAFVFGRVTPGGMLANLVLIGAAKLAVYLGASGLAISYVSESLARHLNNLEALAIRAMVTVADMVSRMPGANFETGKWPLSLCVAWYAVIALIAFVWIRRCRNRFFA